MSLRRGLLSLAIVAISLFAVTPSKIAYQFNREGVSLYRAGDLEGAERKFRAAIEAEPNRALYHYHLGGVLKEQGKLKEAEIEFRRTIALDSTHSLAHNSLGLLLRWQHKLDSAKIEYLKAIKFDLTNYEAYCNLGILLEKENKPDSAELMYRKSIEAKPNYAPAQYSLGCIMQDKNHLDSAEIRYRLAIDLDSGCYEAYNALGLLLKWRGELDSAELLYRRAITCNPKSASIHSNLGVVLLEKKNFDGAERAFRTAIDVNSMHPYARSNLAYVLFLKGNFNEAEKEAYKAFENRDEFKTDTLNRNIVIGNLAILSVVNGFAKLRLGDLEQAQEKSERVFDLLEQHEGIFVDTETKHLESGASFLLGCVYLNKRRLNKAIERFEYVLVLNPEDASARYNLGYAYFLKCKWSEAERYTNAAFELRGREYPLAEELLEDIPKYRNLSKKSLESKWWVIPIMVVLSFGCIIGAIKLRGLKWLFFGLLGLFVLLAVLLLLAMVLPITEASFLTFTVKLDESKVEVPTKIPLEPRRIEYSPASIP
ncbi:hypothetical protein CEE36_08100 [candidate division TA06 bacterium B3_TA06]|uniref:Uncharacterized protein n=1 Tax=candidate division TA06 bacterium B3_TA06 TaxID=2012487 RepID=A0A532V2J3_UNCT6|nr:MAG: hypothetical protein CEE36_08100 [candidate division TA06 bacterium B3_TA06]